MMLVSSLQYFVWFWYGRYFVLIGISFGLSEWMKHSCTIVFELQLITPVCHC